MKVIDLSAAGRANRIRLVRDAVIGLLQGEMAQEHISVVVSGVAAAYARVALLAGLSSERAQEILGLCWNSEEQR